MKKLTALFLSLALLLVLCACGAPNASSGNASSGDAYASWGDASSGDAYASWGDASAGDAYAGSGNATGTLALTEAPAAADTPYFCVQMEQSRLYAIPYGGGEAKLLADKYTNCFDQNGDSVLASFDDGSAARINVLTGESEEILPAGTQQFHRRLRRRILQHPRIEALSLRRRQRAGGDLPGGVFRRRLCVRRCFDRQ